jgi:hypothetical protein
VAAGLHDTGTPCISANVEAKLQVMRGAAQPFRRIVKSSLLITGDGAAGVSDPTLWVLILITDFIRTSLFSSV